MYPRMKAWKFAKLLANAAPETPSVPQILHRRPPNQHILHASAESIETDSGKIAVTITAARNRSAHILSNGKMLSTPSEVFQFNQLLRQDTSAHIPDTSFVRSNRDDHLVAASAQHYKPGEITQSPTKTLSLFARNVRGEEARLLRGGSYHDGERAGRRFDTLMTQDTSPDELSDASQDVVMEGEEQALSQFHGDPGMHDVEGLENPTGDINYRFSQGARFAGHRVSGMANFHRTKYTRGNLRRAAH